VGIIRTIFVRKSLEEYLLGRLRRECEDDIKMDLKYARLEHGRFVDRLRIFPLTVFNSISGEPCTSSILSLPLCTLLSYLFDYFTF
jgi:hypothetical protein